MSLQPTKSAFWGFLLLFLVGLSLPGRAQQPSIIYVSPDPNSIYTTVNTYCVNGTIGVGFSDYLNTGICDATLNPNIYNADNRYVLQLSDANGSFASPTIIATSSYFTPSCRRVASGGLSGPIPATVVAGTGYRVRVATTSPVTYGGVFNTDLTIQSVAPQPDFGGNVTVAQNSTFSLTNTAPCPVTLTWGRTNGDMAIGFGSTINVPTTQLGVVSYTAVCGGGQRCKSPANVFSATVVAVTPPFLVTLVSSGVSTCARSATVLCAAANATSYTLSGPVTISNPSVQFPVRIPVSLPGDYTMTVGNAAGLTAWAPITVPGSVTAPTATLTSSGTITCATPSATLTAGTGASYALSNGQTNTTGQFVVESGGVYTVTVTGSNGCIASATATVESSTAVPSGVNLTSGTLTCAQTSLILTGTANNASSYSLSNGQSNATGSFTVNAPGTYTLTVSNANGCTATATATVDQDALLPTLTVSPPSGTLTCAQTSLTLTATSSATALVWTGNVQSNSLVVNAVGTYSVTATSPNGCSRTASVATSQNTTAPTAGLVPSNTTLTCTRTTVTLTASGGSTYGFAGTGLVASSGNSATINAPNTFTVTVTGANGCTATQTATITSNTVVVTPTLTASPNATLTCAQTSLTLTAGGGDTYTFGGPTPISQAGNLLVVNATGTYSVTATNTASGCFSSTTLAVSQTNAGLITVALTTPNTNLTTTAPTALLTATPGAGTYRFVGPGLNQTGPGNTATGAQAGVFSVTAGLGICATTASITLTGSGGPAPAPSPFAVVQGVLSCQTPTATIEVVGGDQFSFTDANGTQDGIVSVFDGSFRDLIGEGYRLVRTPIPTLGRAVVSKPGTYIITARNGNSAPTQIQVVVTGVACP
ncbi:MAG: hypothetical protein EAZ91_03780 [Cytophagales bacterium]|nr:MAG: hypothetical protein EAZ91_03780 [Cytophagales bacterium]